MILRPFGINPSAPLTKQQTPAGAYGNQGGNEAVHIGLVEIGEEILLVLLLSAMAAKGGNLAKLSLAIMVGIVFLWIGTHFSSAGFTPTPASNG